MSTQEDVTKRSVLALMPEDTPDYMTQAWMDCLMWAVGHEDIMRRFREDTGMRWRPGRSGIERAIDQATGVEWAFVETFTKWFNVNIWGTMDGPDPEASA